MAVERGPKSLHEHNKSLLYSNRPKFKEDIRDNIYLDKIRNDGVHFETITNEQLEKVLSQIRLNSKKEFQRDLKIWGLSILIAIVIMMYLKVYLDNRF